MEIRPMEWTDYQKVYALWLSCPGMGLNDLDDSLEGIGRFCRETQKPVLWRWRGNPLPAAF